MEEWDPIGVHGIAEAQNEYDNYLNPLVRLLREGSSEAVADYLTRIEEDFMGLGPSPAIRERSVVVAALLIDWYAGEMAVEGQ
jgi:hypothetical protein